MPGALLAYNVGGVGDPGRLWLSWSNGNQLQLSYINSESQGGRVCEVQLASAWDAELRRLAFNSLPAFALLQNQRQHYTNDWWENVLQYSKSIKKVLDEYQQDGKVTSLKAIWELIEVFYVDRSAASWLPERLADWLADYDRVLSDEDTIYAELASVQGEIHNSQFPEDLQNYWDVMASALSVGWLDITIMLLRLHGSYRLDQLDGRQTENGLVEAVTLLVTKMPRLRPRLPDDAPGVAISFKPDFSKSWERWRGQVSKLENSVYWAECSHRGTLLGLKKLIQVMLGNVDVLIQCTSHWMELMVAHFLYVIPFTLVSEGMRGVAVKCKQLKPTGNENFHELLSSIVSNDTEILIAKCSTVFDPWMMAHAGELLVAKGKEVHAIMEEERRSIGGVSLQELHRLTYSQVLSSHTSTWQLAPVYLASCPKQGLGTLEALLLRQGCASQKIALKALEICRLYDLDVVGTAIGRALGLHHLKHGRQGPAVMWLQWARDETRLSAIADQFLRNLTSGDSETDQLDNLEHFEGLLDAGSVKYEGLSFLTRYKSFKLALRNIRDTSNREKLTALGREAVASLLQLLKPGAFPRRFWMSLLYDSVGLLEWRDDVLITETETHTLLRCLEELSMAEDRKEADVFHDTELNSVERVRLALARNLGRAVLKE